MHELRPRGVQLVAREQRSRALHLREHLDLRLRFRGNKRFVEHIFEPRMAAGHHTRHVEVVQQRPRLAVGSRAGDDVPQRMPRVASIRVIRRHLQTPVEVAEQRFCECEARRVGRNELRARVRERVLFDFARAARLLLRRRLARPCIGVDVGDASRPRFQRRHAERVEQPIHERFAPWRELVRKTAEFHRDAALRGFAAVGANLDSAHAGEERRRPVVARKIYLQLRKRALALAPARVAAHADLDAVDRDRLAAVAIAERPGDAEILVRAGPVEQRVERRLELQ